MLDYNNLFNSKMKSNTKIRVRNFKIRATISLIFCHSGEQFCNTVVFQKT